MTKYIHLIDGRPGRFSGEQICYAGTRGFKIMPVNSLRKINSERKKSISFRKKFGYDIPKYSYALVEDEEK